MRKTCGPVIPSGTRTFPPSSLVPSGVIVVPPRLIRTPARGRSLPSRTCAASIVCPGAWTTRLVAPARVTGLPSIWAVPCTAIPFDPSGVLPVVVSVSVAVPFGASIGDEKRAVTPGGSGPVPSVTSPVKLPVAGAPTRTATLRPCTAATLGGSTVRVTSPVVVTVKGWLAVPCAVVTVTGPVVAPMGTVVVSKRFDPRAHSKLVACPRALVWTRGKPAALKRCVVGLPGS